MTEEEFIEMVLSKHPPNTKMVKVEKDGYTYFKIGELNIDKMARLLKELIKEQDKI
ncbi:MAG: hypothetical protein RR440_00250 [Erysipelotrichaceae bacterium]